MNDRTRAELADMVAQHNAASDPQTKLIWRARMLSTARPFIEQEADDDELDEFDAMVQGNGWRTRQGLIC